MFDNLRKSLGLWYARWQFRKEHDAPQQFTDFVRRARNILIVLPSGYDNALVAGNTLKKVFDRLENAHLTILTTGIRATALSDMGRSEVVRLDDVDITKLFLPRRTVLHRLLGRTYDMAIDLNLDFVLHAAYICKASRASVRVGIKHQNSEHFYNIQLNLSKRTSPAMLYEKFAQFLEMF